MITWLWAFFVTGQFCQHEWKTLVSGPESFSGYVVGRYYDLRCEKCGNIKNVSVRS